MSEEFKIGERVRIRENATSDECCVFEEHINIVRGRVGTIVTPKGFEQGTGGPFIQFDEQIWEGNHLNTLDVYPSALERLE